MQSVAARNRQARISEAQARIDSVSERFPEKQQGDTWASRGAAGQWTRVHATPRRALFTPCRVARGPSRTDALANYRRTRGVDEDGVQFEIVDNWRHIASAHRLLMKPWTGTTDFVARVIADAKSLGELRQTELGA